MASAPTVLALDLGTSLGWAFARGGVIEAWGVEDLSIKGDDPHAAGDRLIKFHNWLHGDNSIPGWGGVQEVFFEIAGANFRNMSANEVYYQLKGVLRMFCAGCRIPLIGMHNATLKKTFTGDGRAQKQDMCRYAHNLGWKGGKPGTAMDHDAADAVALIVCLLKARDIPVRFA